MNIQKAIAGCFAGAGGLLCIYLGVSNNIDALWAGGMLMITNMFTFFVGEANGQKKAEAKETD